MTDSSKNVKIIATLKQRYPTANVMQWQRQRQGLCQRQLICQFPATGVPVAQWIESWPADLACRVRSPLEATSSQP